MALQEKRLLVSVSKKLAGQFEPRMTMPVVDYRAGTYSDLESGQDRAPAEVDIVTAPAKPRIPPSGGGMHLSAIRDVGTYRVGEMLEGYGESIARYAGFRPRIRLIECDLIECARHDRIPVETDDQRSQPIIGNDIICIAVCDQRSTRRKHTGVARPGYSLRSMVHYAKRQHRPVRLDNRDGGISRSIVYDDQFPPHAGPLAGKGLQLVTDQVAGVTRREHDADRRRFSRHRHLSIRVETAPLRLPGSDDQEHRTPLARRRKSSAPLDHQARKLSRTTTRTHARRCDLRFGGVAPAQ